MTNYVTAQYEAGNNEVQLSTSRNGVLGITLRDKTRKTGQLRTAHLRREQIVEIIAFLNESLLFSQR